MSATIPSVNAPTRDHGPEYGSLVAVIADDGARELARKILTGQAPPLAFDSTVMGVPGAYELFRFLHSRTEYSAVPLIRVEPYQARTLIREMQRKAGLERTGTINAETLAVVLARH